MPGVTGNRALPPGAAPTDVMAASHYILEIPYNDGCTYTVAGMESTAFLFSVYLPLCCSLFCNAPRLRRDFAHFILFVALRANRSRLNKGLTYAHHPTAAFKAINAKTEQGVF